ncbi:ATP-binding cassette domain-containing protein [Arthrobacter sp.]|uniref:ATP-binding cassette domain-containing protein n=1 Tax=Arthrobacter sp. TaxID=1667 RepID=UPI003A90608A
MSSQIDEKSVPPAALVFDDVTATDKKSGNAKRGPLNSISNVSLVVNAGEAIGLLGGPADGTSVLLRTAAGRIAPSRGDVYIGPRPTLMDTGSAFDLGDTLQANVERIAMSLELNGSRLKSAVSKILTRMEAEEQADTPCAEIDALKVERVRLAAILQAGPSLLLIDEPLARGRALLADEGREGLERHLRLGGALVLAGQNPVVMRKICSRIIWLHKGEVILDAPTSEASRKYKLLEGVSGDRVKTLQMYRRIAGQYPGLKIITQSPR